MPSGFGFFQYKHTVAAIRTIRARPRNVRMHERQLQQAVASGRHILAAETWNEFSEGTDIQETVETGRQYIDLTRRYLDEFKGFVGARP